jgi:DsbC/DsbD-like thiol-disulfide interchange protein/cytochrome c biogenesis protein CcdA
MKRRNSGMRMFHAALMMAAFLAMSLPGLPAEAQLPQPGRNAMKVSLAPETRSPAPGETITLAIRMTPDPGWHGYWKNPGDAGAENRIAWNLPAGLSAGPLLYPVPARLTIAGLMNYVFEGPYSVLADLKIPAGIKAGTPLPVRAKLDYLVCSPEICIPESASIGVDLVVGGPSRRADGAPAFARLREALPKPLGSPGRFDIADGKLRLAVPLPASFTVTDPYFFPLTDGVLDYSAPQQVARQGDMLIVATDADERAGSMRRIEGVLKTGETGGLLLSAARGAVPAPVSPGIADASLSSLPAVLLGAIIGGLLLNIMPCVFPILSLKALSLAKAGGDERTARREALAYTAGVVAVCLALGAALLGLRAGGAAVGWAFQLQDPRVILFLLLLIVAIALNLAGLFELPALAAGGRAVKPGGTGGAFWTGALAAFVATPCTGPFMGAALGAALILPPAAALAVFAGLGLGLALPFLVLGFIPALRRKLPKPGAWMARFRRLLSVPMFATALGLAWVLGRQAGVDGMAIGLGAASVLALGLWWVGRRQGRDRAWLPIMPVIAIAVAAIFLVPASAPAVARAPDALGADPFSEARLAALRAEGRPVFVYFTADWCLTCKVNEKGVLEREEVAKSFAARNMAVLVGDWTSGDAEIGHFLEKHGRSGVPLYLYYAPRQPAQVLPQLLTASRLTRLAS